MLDHILDKKSAINQLREIYGKRWQCRLSKDTCIQSGNLGKIFNNPKPFTRFQAMAFTYIIEKKTNQE